MRKLYVILTTSILAIVLVHIVYMVVGILGGFEINPIFAIILGYALVALAVLHGIYGLTKWIRVLINRKRLTKKSGVSNCVSAAKTITIIQRISAVMVVALIIPHTFIEIAEADVLLTIVDVLFVLALVVHLFIGIPKWLVSMGLLGEEAEKKLSRFYGGKGNA